MKLFEWLFPKKPDLTSILNDGAIILDVRQPHEFNRGHAKGAMNIPVGKLESRIGSLRKKNKPFVTCCASGMRSRQAAKILNSRGLEAHNGGSWQQVERFKQGV